MPVLVAVRHDEVQDIFVTGDVRPRHYFFDHEGLHSLSFEERTSALESLHGYLTIRWVREMVWVDGR